MHIKEKSGKFHVCIIIWTVEQFAAQLNRNDNNSVQSAAMVRSGSSWESLLTHIWELKEQFGLKPERHTSQGVTDV